MKLKTLEEACSVMRILQKKIEIPPLPKSQLRKSKTGIHIDDGSPNPLIPINRQASRILSKSPWYFHPPTQDSNQIQKMKLTTQTPENVIKSENKKCDKKMFRDFMSKAYQESHIKVISEENFSKDITTALVRELPNGYEKTVVAQETLVERAKQAMEAMEYIVTHQQSAWGELEEQLNKKIVAIRSKKIAAELESRQLLSALNDVRKFFFDDKHNEEVKRLTEFVSLCERLKALKESGFLDDVADTILKLNS